MLTFILLFFDMFFLQIVSLASKKIKDLNIKKSSEDVSKLQGTWLSYLIHIS